MTQTEQIDRLKSLISYLMQENFSPQTINAKSLLSSNEEQLKHIYRGMINTRLPYPISDGFLELQDEFLTEDLNSRGIVYIDDLEPVSDQLYLWQGDITRLSVDAIVNAANSDFLGCFIPNHRCIDNEIQTKGGYQIRLDCYDLIQKQGHKEPVGKAKVTPGHNLPSKYIIHTVGPIVTDQVSTIKKSMLASCYQSILEKALEIKLNHVALCCISTGQFGFPANEAAQIAVDTVHEFLNTHSTDMKIIFNVFKNSDYDIYSKLINTEENYD